MYSADRPLPLRFLRQFAFLSQTVCISFSNVSSIETSVLLLVNFTNGVLAWFICGILSISSDNSLMNYGSKTAIMFRFRLKPIRENLCKKFEEGVTSCNNMYTKNETIGLKILCMLSSTVHR